MEQDSRGRLCTRDQRDSPFAVRTAVAVVEDRDQGIDVRPESRRLVGTVAGGPHRPPATVLALALPLPHFPMPPSGLSLRGGKRGFITPPETNADGDALCFMVKAWARPKTTETVLNTDWRLAAVGGWWRLAVAGWWRLAVGGGWWLAVLGGYP